MLTDRAPGALLFLIAASAGLSSIRGAEANSIVAEDAAPDPWRDVYCVAAPQEGACPALGNDDHADVSAAMGLSDCHDISAIRAPYEDAGECCYEVVGEIWCGGEDYDVDDDARGCGG